MTFMINVLLLCKLFDRGGFQSKRQRKNATAIRNLNKKKKIKMKNKITATKNIKLKKLKAKNNKLIYNCFLIAVKCK